MAQGLMLQIAARYGAIAMVVVLAGLLLVALNTGAKHFLGRLRTHTEGVAAVEFAIILPVLMLLILGGMDVGHMLYIDHLITNASREGARDAVKYTNSAVDPGSDVISAYVKTTLNYNTFNLANFNVTVNYTGSSPDKIATVTVTADKNWWILGSLGFANPKTLKATTAMAVERP
jgi:Flp pilus assembly protein TadG